MYFAAVYKWRKQAFKSVSNIIESTNAIEGNSLFPDRWRHAIIALRRAIFEMRVFACPHPYLYIGHETFIRASFLADFRDRAYCFRFAKWNCSPTGRCLVLWNRRRRVSLRRTIRDFGRQLHQYGRRGDVPLVGEPYLEWRQSDPLPSKEGWG